MIRAFLAFLFILLATPACAQPAPAPQPAHSGPTQTAIFAGGCFWCMETDMAAIPGVVSVESGYTGGMLDNPSYEDVLTERTGHYEAVRVTFDPSRITYRQLVDRYWLRIDPTDDGGQFCDRGPSYRSAIFATSAQRADAQASKDALIASDRLTLPVVTQILPVATFYPAEEYHRDYARRNPLRYAAYREGCGRTARLREIWRDRAVH